METPLSSPGLRGLRAGLHLLVAALLLLVAVRALSGGEPHAAEVIVAVVLFGALYAGGTVTPRLRQSRAIARSWLASLCAAWLVLLALTPDGTWLAFPLFLIQLHLLQPREGIATVAITTMAAVVAFTAHRGSFLAAAAIGPALGAAVAIAAVLGYQTLYTENEQRRRLIQQLDATRDELAATERLAGVAAERERLAREIHDTLAQGLTSIQLLLRAAERALPGAPITAAEHVRVAREAAQDNLAEARRFVHALTPPDLDRASLPAALRRLCETVGEQTQLAVTFRVSGDPVAVAVAHEVALLRVAQSALANAAQHAQAKQLTVTLSYMDADVALDVIDDGIGFATGAAEGSPDGGEGFGLSTMRARTASHGGTLSIESAPGQGTAIAASLPYRAAPGPESEPA